MHGQPDTNHDQSMTHDVSSASLPHLLQYPRHAHRSDSLYFNDTAEDRLPSQIRRELRQPPGAHSGGREGHDWLGIVGRWLLCTSFTRWILLLARDQSVGYQGRTLWCEVGEIKQSFPFRAPIDATPREKLLAKRGKLLLLSLLAEYRA